MPMIADKAAELSMPPLRSTPATRGEPIVKALLDPFNPAGSTDHVSFITSKTTLWQTRPRPSPRQLRGLRLRLGGRIRPRRRAPSRDDLLRQEPGPWLRGTMARWRAQPRRYLPDFIVRIDDGRGPTIR